MVSWRKEKGKEGLIKRNGKGKLEVELWKGS